MGEVLLVRPAGGPAEAENAAYEHLGLGYLASWLEEHDIAVDVCDSVLRPRTDEDIARLVASGGYELVGVTIPSQEAATPALRVAQVIKRACPEAHLTLGGHFPTAAHDFLLTEFAEIDSIVRGEGEKPLLELALRVLSKRKLTGVSGVTYRRNGHIVSERSTANRVDLDSLPFPRRDFRPPRFGDIQYATILSSRGCQYGCAYCSIHSFYGCDGWRGRSVANVVDEMEQLYREGITGFYFTDDNFVPPGRPGEIRAGEFCRELRDRELRDLTLVAMMVPSAVKEATVHQLVDVGLRSLLVGLESASASVLRRLRKATTPAINGRVLRTLSKFDLSVTVGFIMFDPETSLTDIRKNTAFLKQHIDCVHDCRLLNRLEVYTGTRVYEDLRARGRLTGDYLHPEYEFSDERVDWLFEVSTGLLGKWIDLLETKARGARHSQHRLPPAHRRRLWRRAFLYMLTVLENLTSYADSNRRLPGVHETVSRLAGPVDRSLEQLTGMVELSRISRDDNKEEPNGWFQSDSPPGSGEGGYSNPHCAS